MTDSVVSYMDAVESADPRRRPALDASGGGRYPPTDTPSSGGGGGDGRMEARIARLESDVSYVKREIVDIKSDVKAIRSDVRSDFRWLITAGASGVVALLGSIVGLAGLIAKGFGWL